MDIILASGNAKKIKELQQTLEPLNCNIIPQSNFNIPSPEETGLSFIENAILKARHAAEYSGLAAVADDSGLCVDALLGSPGIYSARYSEMNKKINEGLLSDPTMSTDEKNNATLLQALMSVKNRSAFFYCALAFVSHKEDPTPLVVTGKWHGDILTAAQGENGFGYDPLFFVKEHQCSSAQLAPSVKNKISHRGVAMQKLLPALKKHLKLS